MPDWLRRLHHSRTARNWTLGALGVWLVGGTGGMLLANYTVAGMNQIRPLHRPMGQLAAEVPDSEWMRANRQLADQIDVRTGFASDDDARYSDASY